LKKAKEDGARKIPMLSALKKERDTWEASNKQLEMDKLALEKKLDRSLHDSKAKVAPPPSLCLSAGLLEACAWWLRWLLRGLALEVVA